MVREQQNEQVASKPVPVGEDGWFGLDETAEILHCSRRHAARMIGQPAAHQVRTDPSYSGVGRPPLQYHFTAHPALTAHRRISIQPSAVSVQPDESPSPRFSGSPDRILSESPVLPVPESPAHSSVLRTDDLAIARFRAMAVEEYIKLRQILPEAQAATAVCQDWSRRPRTAIVRVTERLPHNHVRETQKTIGVGGFGTSTLRAWHMLYCKECKSLSALAPKRKGQVGRRAAVLPEPALDLVLYFSTTQCRGDVAKALRMVSGIWPAPLPEVSIATWRRRIAGRDPAKAFAVLGKLGLAEFGRRHTPDVARDYTRNQDGSTCRFNQLWQLDDATLDFYGHGFDPNRLVRPFVYKVLRVSTRQWICSVACETPITQDQVRELLGLAMADKAGGIPEEITFERGAIACDDYLQGLLEDLGVKVHRTSMDGGQVHPGAEPDRRTGHWQGKLIEANMGRMHAAMWDAPLQTGPDERRSAPANLEPLKAEAVRRLAAGEKLITMTGEEWQAYVAQKDNEMNNAPHSGLPEILVNAETGERRHMTPNEYAAELLKREEAAGVKRRVLDPNVLPMFFRKGFNVPVTRNGIMVKKVNYGRFDSQLAAFAGRKVLVYALPEYPHAAYIQELGRCILRHDKPAYGAGQDELAAKRRIRGEIRNQFEALAARAADAARTITLQSIRFAEAPVPAAAPELFATEALLRRSRGIDLAVTADKTAERQFAKRFTLRDGAEVAVHAAGGFDPAAAAPRGKRRSLASRAADLEAQVGALAGVAGPGEKTPFSL